MTKRKEDLSKGSTAELVTRFTDLAIRQSVALMLLPSTRNTSRCKPLQKNLNSRPGDQRRVLMKLYNH